MGKLQEKGFLKHFFNIGLGTVINVLLGFLTTPLITRIVDPVEYAQFTMFNTYVSIILGFVYFGLDNALTRFFYESDEVQKQKGLLKFCFFVPVLVAIIILIGFYVLIKLNVISTKFTDFIILLLCFNVLISIWNQFSTIMLRMTYKSKEFSICNVGQKAIYCIIVIGYALAIKTHYLYMLIFATSASIFISALLATKYTKEYWSFSEVRMPVNYKEIVKYALPFVIFSFTETMADSIDKFLIESLCSEYELGIYSASLTLMAIFAMVQTSFNAVWAPMQTEHYTKNPDDTTFIQKGNRYITIIMFFCAINVIMFKDIICYILGPSYREAAIYIPFVIIDPIMYTLAQTTYSGIEKSKKSYLNIVVSLLACITNIIGNVLLLPIFGPMGSAITRALSCTVFFVARTYFSNKNYYIDYGIKKLIIIILTTFVFAFLASFKAETIYLIITYMLCLVVFFMLYSHDAKEMIHFFKESLFKK